MILHYADPYSLYGYRYARREKIYAALFAVFLSGVLAMLLTFAALYSGPIVLGTEMNTNGLIEYMCLGNGCEDVQSFRWQD